MYGVDDDQTSAVDSGLLDRLYLIFRRIVAVGCLLSALFYWSRLIGLSAEGQFRFDLLPAYWQTAAAGLSVLFPIAALGLWVGAAWGGVIWFLAAGTEVIMYYFMADLFGSRPLVVIAYALVVVVYIAFRLAYFLHERERARNVTPDSL
ncbi:hypothetical protein KY465_15870 [Pseudohoeflea sp. DP4N28-3]|uniref:Uncharacterized protein n=2 Tax=Pseudohoeflea coraliihabitans TaxID=2860393 RepID=A0ABS6WSZ9_9HYPH|nr:DUF6163 family protein [Pseudohoeflea sp. DP4N28-3]MBW3098763.1 hypothetical protein [Pseudohoeflea sp. DP4N28-3]